MFTLMICAIYFLVGDLWFVIEFMSEGEANVASILIVTICMIWFDLYFFIPNVIEKIKDKFRGRRDE